MKPEDVPEELLSLYGRNYMGSSSKVAARRAMAAVIPEIERQVRERVAAELRDDADAHRRVVARKPSEYDEARLARAQTLDDAAARISGKRGDPCEGLAAVTVLCNDLASVLDDHQLWMLAQPADEQDWEAHDRLSVALDPEWARDAASEGGPGTARIARGES